MVGDAQRLRKAEPINQPYIMFHWARGWSAVPKTDEAGSSPAWSTRKCPCGVIGNILRYERRDLRVRILSWVQMQV